MSEGMARLVALGVGGLLAVLIVVIFGTDRRTGWIATAIAMVTGLALYLVLTWDS